MKILLHRTIVGLLTMTMLIQIAGMQPVQSVQARPDSYMQEIQESTPDPTVAQQPPIDTQPTIQPTIEPTAEATEEPLPTQPQETIQLSLQIEKNVYLPDETLQLIWSLEGDLLQEKETNLELEICVPAEIIPSAELEKSFNWETGCTKFIFTDPKGELGFKVTNQYFGIMSISGVVLRDGLAITSGELEFEVLNPDTLLEGPSIQMEQTAFLVKNGNLLTTNLVIQGYGNFPDIKEMVLEICPMEAIQAVDEALIASRDAENPCYRKIVDQAEITLDWQLDKESTYKDTQLQFYLIADAVPVSYKEIDIYFEPSATIAADRSQQVVEKTDSPTVIFPAEAANRAMDITIKRASASEDPKILVGTVFRLNAFDAETGQEIKQFDAELVLELSYAGTDIAEDPGLYAWKYFHEGSQIWVYIRTEIDQENQIIRGYTNHFSDFTLDPNDLFAAQIPSLSAADVAGFTGSATYEIPIQVPQGTGSFTPAVSLDYNSQAADQMNSNQQSSIVGLGWNLNAGAVITRNNQKNSNNTDDTFSITIGNISHDLIPIEKTSEYTAYTTKTANFDVIRRYTPNCSTWERYGYWVLWDKTGNIYRFEKAAVFDQIARDCGIINNNRSHAYAWHLSSVEDPSGLITKYTYYKRNYAEYIITQEIYLEDIVYPDGHTRIHFISEEGRTDYLWNWYGAKIPNNERSITQIQVIYDPSIQYDINSGRVIVHGDETVISSYQLNYFDNTSNPIFPNIKWENVEGYKTGRYLALSSVIQKGKNGGEISQISFSYEDHQHLTKVENHAGASVEFTYEADPYYTQNENISKRASKSSVGGLRYNTAIGYVRYTNSAGYSSSYPGQYHKLSCNVAGEWAGDPDTWHPHSSSTQVYFYYDTDYEMSYVPFQSEPISSTLYSGTYPHEIRTFTTYLLPSAEEVGKKSYPGLYATQYGQWGNVTWCGITPLVTRWRVVEKTITEMVSGNETVYTYEYEGGAVNNNDGAGANSAILDTEPINDIVPILAKEYSEFRGHEKTSLFDPQRQTKTVTFYKQDDILAGHAWKIEQWDTSVTPNRQISLQLINYETETLTGLNSLTACAYMDLEEGTDYCYVDSITYFKVRTLSTESRVYDNSGVNYMGLKKAYGYDGYGNVIHTTISVWNGNAWEAKQYQEIGYEANLDIANNKNLVSLPTYTALYTCPGGNCSNNITNLLKFTCTLYNPAAGSASLCGINSDGSVTEIKPSNAIPIGSRSLLEFVNDVYTSPSYQDISLTYDDWGNAATSTSYSGVGTSTSLATSGARTVMYTYDPVFHNRIIRQTDPLDGIVNAITVYQYNPLDLCFWFGKPSAIIDPNGQMTTATCDEFGRLTEVRQPGDESGQATTTVEYYPYQSETDPTNITITQKIDQSQSQSTKYIANGLGQIIQTQQLDALVEGGVHKDLVQTVVYDSLGRQVATEVGTHMLNSGTGYDGNFPPYFIETEYDQQDRVIQITQADGTYTTNAYEIIYFDTSDLLDDQYVLKQTTTDPNGHAQYQYTNVLEQLIEADSNLDDLLIQYEYDQSGNLNKVYQPNKADPAGIQDWNVTEIFYDLAGRKTSMDDVDMGYWEYGYDAIGNLITQTDARNVTSTITYDLANRNTGKSFSSQSGVTTTAAITKDYDGTSILEQFSGSSLPGIFGTSGSPNLSVTGGVMIFTGNGTWDSVMRSEASISDGESVSFVFNKNNNNGQTNALIHTGNYGQANYRRYSFEILNGVFQRTAYTGTNMNVVPLMPFNPNIWYMGMLTVGKSGKFQVKIWERDNPAVMAVYNDSFDSSWQNLNWNFIFNNTQGELHIDNYREHDRMVYRSSMQDGSGSTSWLYDNRGQIVKEIKTISGQGSFMTQWGYNSSGLLVSITYPGGNSGQAGEVLNYTYNKRMLLETMIGNSNYITASQYDSAGRLLERYLNNGTLISRRSYYNWDSDGGQLASIHSGILSAPASIQYLTYSEYDNNGNIKRLDNPYEKNQSGTQVSAKTYYNYDELNRLVDAQMKNPVGSLTYYQQSYGYDELGRLETKAGTTLSYDEPNDKLHAVSSAGTIDYQYDANGNMTLRDTHVPSTRFSFTYDSGNRLVQSASSTTTVTFTYDGDGNRVKTTQTVSGITTTTNLIGRIYEWVSSSNQKRYYYAGSDRIALGTSTNLITYIFSDHLGSTVAIRNSLGSIYRTGYYPFGEERFVNNSTPYQFTGQRKEAAIGLYDYQARFYDSSLGRFVQGDTIVPQPETVLDWDRYSYVRSNPINFTDPTGMYYEENGPGKINNTPIPPPNIINFPGSGWTVGAKNKINNAANIYGWRLLPYAIRELQQYFHMGVYDGPINLKNGAQAFKLIFGELEFVSHTNSCSEYFTSLGAEGASSFDCYGCAAGRQTVFKFRNASMGDLTSEWAGHEISHIFDLHIGLQGRNSITGWMLGSLKGIASQSGMIQNSSLVNYEIFANMADSWAFNIWDTGKYANKGLERKSLMDNYMALWVSLAILGNH